MGLLFSGSRRSGGRKFLALAHQSAKPFEYFFSLLGLLGLLGYVLLFIVLSWQEQFQTPCVCSRKEGQRERQDQLSLLALIKKSTPRRYLHCMYISLARTVACSQFQLQGKLDTGLFQTKWRFCKKKRSGGWKLGTQRTACHGERKNHVNNSVCSQNKPPWPRNINIQYIDLFDYLVLYLECLSPRSKMKWVVECGYLYTLGHILFIDFEHRCLFQIERKHEFGTSANVSMLCNIS